MLFRSRNFVYPCAGESSVVEKNSFSFIIMLSYHVTLTASNIRPCAFGATHKLFSSSPAYLYPSYFYFYIAEVLSVQFESQLTHKPHKTFSSIEAYYFHFTISTNQLFRTRTSQ
jgi:hypothetical protein